MNLGSKHAVKFSQEGGDRKFSTGTWHQIKMRDRGREELSKSVRLTSVVLARRNSRTNHMRKHSTKKDAPAMQSGNWRKHLQTQEFGQNYVYVLGEAKVMSTPIASKRRKERYIVLDSGASMHMMSKKISAQKNFAL